ncbi:zinc finger BED domain-containing protein RICESLEEPER 2 [Tanacetum coccineum]
MKAQHKHCFHFFSQNSNSTLKSHIMHPHCEALKTVPEEGKSSMYRDGCVFMYNPDADVLSVQATSVASESTFTTSGRVLSIRRTRLTPAYLEMCMCLKDHLDSQDRIQSTSSLEHSLDFEEDILEEEVQDNEAIPLSDDEIALDEAASEAMSNGSGSGGEDVDLSWSESE